MVKKVMVYIFIYIFIVGCSNITCDDCYLEIESLSLQMDYNGYYHMEFDGSGFSNQTFTTLKAETRITDKYQKVKRISAYEYNMGNNNWVNLVNQTSYSDDEGKAYTVLGVWDFFIGDTIKVYAGYHNECDIHFVDSLEVIIW